MKIAQDLREEPYLHDEITSQKCRTNEKTSQSQLLDLLSPRLPIRLFRPRLSFWCGIPFLETRIRFDERVKVPSPDAVLEHEARDSVFGKEMCGPARAAMGTAVDDERLSVACFEFAREGRLVVRSSWKLVDGNPRARGVDGTKFRPLICASDVEKRAFLVSEENGERVAGDVSRGLRVRLSGLAFVALSNYTPEMTRGVTHVERRDAAGEHGNLSEPRALQALDRARDFVRRPALGHHDHDVRVPESLWVVFGEFGAEKLGQRAGNARENRRLRHLKWQRPGALRARIEQNVRRRVGFQ